MLPSDGEKKPSRVVSRATGRRFKREKKECYHGKGDEAYPAEGKLRGKGELGVHARG